jgi:hypothetical protein
MEPISITGCVECEPDLYILPIRYEVQSTTSPPVLAEWWQWQKASGGTDTPRWVRVISVG